MDSRTFSSKRNILIGIISSLLVPIMGFLVKTAIVRCLSVEYLGLTSVLSSILQVLNMAELGFSSAIVISLYEPIKEHNVKEIRAILGFYKKVYIIIGIIIIVAGLAFMPFYPRFLGEKNKINVNVYIVYIIYLINSSIGYLFFGYKSALLNAVQRFDITKRIYMIAVIIRDICQLAALLVFKSFYLFAIILLLSSIVQSLSLEIISKRKYSEFYPEGKIEQNTKKKIKEQIAGLSIGKVLDVSRNAFDTLIVSSFFGLAVVGKYNNYFYIYSTIISLAWVIIDAIQASVGNSIVSETKEKNYIDLNKMEGLYSVGLTIGTACLFTLYQPFMSIWMGKDMLFENSIMSLFVIYFYSMAINGVRNAYFFALGLWWKARWLLIAESLSNLVLNIVLGKFFGVKGVLIATILTILIINYFGITKLVFHEYFQTGFFRFIKNRIMYTVITLISCAFSYIICEVISIAGIPGIMIKGMITCLVSTGIVIGSLYILNNDLFHINKNFAMSIIRTNRRKKGM